MLVTLKRQLSVISSIRMLKFVSYMKSMHQRSKLPREPRPWPVSQIRLPEADAVPRQDFQDMKGGANGAGTRGGMRGGWGRRGSSHGGEAGTV